MSSFVKSPAFTPSIVSNLLPCLNVIQQLGTEGHERLAIAIPIISLKLSQIGRKTDDNGVFEFSLILVPYSKT
jgi:hypothetical protein